MIGAVIFEHRYRGDVWRLIVGEYQGRPLCNWRRWYLDSNDALQPTRDGMTFPLDRLPDLAAGIAAYLAGQTGKPS